mmetsp:Transcript_47810/g.94817  ORF Transcript_47810/g.94817 Transcript_47810/m.94817 type:complete len:89 (+) Transcript_47810:82-348(+)
MIFAHGLASAEWANDSTTFGALLAGFVRFAKEDLLSFPRQQLGCYPYLDSQTTLGLSSSRLRAGQHDNALQKLTNTSIHLQKKRLEPH